MIRARPSVALLILLAATAASAAARPAPKPPAPAPTDTAAATDTAASDGSIQVTATMGAAPVPGQWAVCPAPGKFITCLLATQDALWVGTEDASLWRLDLAADPTQPSSWKPFPTADTKTDNIYGLAQDAAGRLWVGTQNQGVSVYNGKKWQNYGVIDGPIGEHVFSIAADPDPSRGTVWIATDHGLTSWTPSADVAPPPSAVSSSAAGPKSKVESPKSTTSGATGSAATTSGATGGLSASASAVDPFAAKGTSAPTLAAGTWRSYTRGDGLPADQIYAVTVAPGGRVWIGTECDGLAWSDPPYKTWTSIRADHEHSGDLFGINGKAALGWQPGLPSNLTNALLAMPDGTLAYSTDYGLALSRNGGQSWSCWQGVGKEAYENYFRGLACDRAGGLWIATRHKGLVRLDPKTGLHRSFAKPVLPDDYVFDVAVTRDGSVWAGTYGGGLAHMGPAASGLPADPSAVAGTKAEASAKVGPQSAIPFLPAPAAPPTLDELNAMLGALSKVPYFDPAKQPAVVRLDDDWLTKGDCLGRYGRYWGCWCALCAPADYYWGAGPEKVTYFATVGPGSRADDDIRYWVHWRYTTNPNSLEIPPTYLDSRIQRGLTTREVNRRQSEWDDHGETYSLSKEGPSLYCTLKIPAGLFYLSLYNFNKDGHQGSNRLRDFRTSIRPQPAQANLMNISGFSRHQELGHGRMRDFWGGVYERYLVRGPTQIAIEVNRNHSFCTILAGVFLDLVDEEPLPYFHSLEEWQALSDQQTKDRDAFRNLSGAELAALFSPASNEAEAAAKVFEELERTRFTNCVWWACEGRRFYSALLRWTEATERNNPTAPTKGPLLRRAATCNYQLGRFQQWEAEEVAMGKKPARQVEKSLRWDGLRVDCRGSGFAIVNEALAKTAPSVLSRP